MTIDTARARLWGLDNYLIGGLVTAVPCGLTWLDYSTLRVGGSRYVAAAVPRPFSRAGCWRSDIRRACAFAACWRCRSRPASLIERADKIGWRRENRAGTTSANAYY